ncbi:unnamed protein product [Sympodiomycopsis kandeliae]
MIAETRAAVDTHISTAEKWAQKRKEVLSLHPTISLDKSPRETSEQRQDVWNLEGRSIREHALWKRFMTEADDDRENDTVEAVAGDFKTLDVTDQKTYDDLTQLYFSPVYTPEEQTLRADHSWNYAASGLQKLPADAVRNPYLEGRFTEYPKLRRLVDLKQTLVDSSAAPPTYLRTDLRDSINAPPLISHGTEVERFHLATLVPVKYDVVLIDPPLAAYEWASVPSSSNRQSQRVWSWDEVSELPIPLLAAKESFVFLWVGPGCSDGLERGREALSRWGYRRCEVITWCLTSKEDRHTTTGGNAFATSSVHCLMGIRGTVRRSNDTNFVHCNIDTDVLFWPGEGADGTDSKSSPIDLRKKPPELYSLIENFCLGTRRVELFGTNRNIRRGWLTIGHPDDLGPDAPGWKAEHRPDRSVATHNADCKTWAPREYAKHEYDSNFSRDPAGCQLRDRSNVVPFDDVVDKLRPRSPNQAYDHINQRLMSSPLDARQDTGQTSVNAGQLPRGLGASSYARNTKTNPRRQQQCPKQPSVMPMGTSVRPNNVLMNSSTGSLAVPSYPPSGGPGGSAGASATYSPTHVSRSPTAGLGAGGPVTVSVPSGSDTLSGPQKSAIGLGLAASHQHRGSAASGKSREDAVALASEGGDREIGEESPSHNRFGRSNRSPSAWKTGGWQ